MIDDGGYCCTLSQQYRCARCLSTYGDELNVEIKKLRREIEVLRFFGNDDCTALADETLASETGTDNGNG